MFAWFVIGSFAVWRLTWDLTSCAPDDLGECKPNLEGPFHLYDGVRWLLARPQLPQWVQEGSTCPFCVSMWVAGFFALLLLIDGLIPRTIAAWLLYTIGMSTPAALIMRYIKTIYGVPPREF